MGWIVILRSSSCVDSFKLLANLVESSLKGGVIDSHSLDSILVKLSSGSGTAEAFHVYCADGSRAESDSWAVGHSSRGHTASYRQGSDAALKTGLASVESVHGSSSLW